MSSSQGANSSASPLRMLSPLGAVASIGGIVIGAGIFKTPAMVAGITGDVGWAISIWVAGALISLMGALCYAELATLYPHAGGDLFCVSDVTLYACAHYVSKYLPLVHCHFVSGHGTRN